MINPLKDYEDFIENAGIEKCYNVFLKKIETLKSYLYPESLSTSENGFIDDTKNTYLLTGIRPGAENIIHKDGNEILGLILVTSDEIYKEHIYFKDILECEFNTIYQKTIKNLNGLFRNSLSEDEIKQQIIITLDALKYLHDFSADINHYGLLSVIQTNILKVVKYINLKYKSYSVSHSLYDLIIADANPNGNNTLALANNDNVNEQKVLDVFGFKGNRTDLKELYNSLTEIGLFDEDNNQLNQFLTIFYNPPPTMLEDLQPTIKVFCTNEIAAYTFDKIQKFFSRLRFFNIASSNIILNKKGKPFTRGSLDTAKSKFLNRAKSDDEIMTTVDEIIDSLKFKF